MAKSKIVSSLFFKSVERFGVKGFGLIIGVVLARMLSPREFGQIAIMMVFINLSIVLNQSGFNTALLQKKNPTEIDYNTVFYITLVIAVLCFGLIFLLAPIISAYYEDPALTLPLRVYATSLIFTAFNSIQITRLEKQMRFRPLMVCTLLATVLSGFLGVIAAYCGAGLWALVAYYMSNTVFISIAILFVECWYPRLQVSLQSARELFSFGWKMLVAAVVCAVTEDLRSLIVGKRFSSTALGYYNRGWQFPKVFSTTMTYSVQSVMLPAMSDVQSESDRLRDLLRRTVSLGNFLIMPAMLGMAAVADSFVRVVLSEKWLPCVIYLQIFAVSDAFIHIITSNLTVIKAAGRSDVYMRLELARRAMYVIILCINVFYFHSVMAIAVGYWISNWVDCAMIVVTVKWRLKIGIAYQLRELWKTVLASGAMLAVLLLMNKLQLPAMWLLLLQIATGIVIYLGLSLLLRNESMSVLKNMLLRKR